MAICVTIILLYMQRNDLVGIALFISLIHTPYLPSTCALLLLLQSIKYSFSHALPLFRSYVRSMEVSSP